jgi:transketolase
MALEDLAAFRAVHGSTVLHPSDANQAARLVAEMADRPGISYMRTLRPKTPVRTAPDEPVAIGGSRAVRCSPDDEVTIVACGITVDEADKAADELESRGIRARVIDCYSIKPIDSAALATAARETGAIVTVEDHWPEGGLGDAVLAALAEEHEPVEVVKLAVRDMPMSGDSDELMHAAEIDAGAIIAAVTELVRVRSHA